MIPTYRPYVGPEELEAIRKVFQSRWLGMGAVTEDFEKRIKKFLGVKNLIAVNSGTSALHIALDALGVGHGDDVVVPTFTFTATVQAILMTGAKPVFCDICQDTLNIDVDDLEKRLTPSTKVIMPVHFGGSPCDMDKLMSLTNKTNIKIVEDAAHAFGSTYKGHSIGTLGDITCFSFDPIKNITCGEGGAIATNNDDIAKKIRLKRMLGIDKDSWSRQKEKNSWYYNVITTGYRYHMSNINAAIGIEQMKRLNVFKKRKQAIVKKYDEAFADLKGLKGIKHETDEIFPFFYVLRVLNKRRDSFMRFLKDKGIATGIHYIPNHLHKLFAKEKISLPVAENIYKEVVTLPMYYEMTDNEVEFVIATVNSFFDSRNI
ncbi:MAG: DegT/DnrJ/EryC1/StrS family aminotransferase [Planctomycetota bacterium]|jgi:perosamine synthetase